MQRPAGPREGATAELVQRLVGSLRDLHVESYVTKGAAETTEALRGILSKAGSKSVITAGIPEKYMGAVRAAMDGLTSSPVEELRGRPPNEAVGVIAGADAGVTWASHAVAAEGALLELVYDDSFKLASSLPIVHVALLESSSVLRDLAEALAVVGAAVRDAPDGRKPIVSFISGPSKTGDIEMRLLYGVHGPHTVRAIILDWR